MRSLIFVAVSALLLSAQGAPNPVIEHYRAYNTAIQAGDTATAEREADAALQASIARDGNGGRTAVLALNLAKVRLHNNHIYDAYAPAQQALAIASSNPAAGVDPLLARLVLGCAELTEQRETSGRERLLAALEEATTHPEVGADAYEAAVQLAQWTALREDFGILPAREGDVSVSARAWAYAVRFAEYSGGDHILALAEALLAEGVARFNTFRQNPAAGQADHARSIEALTQAARILSPLAAQRPTRELTVAQRDYGYALAWGMNTGATGAHPDAFPAAFSADPSALTPDTYCPTRIIADPQPHYPIHAASIERQGTVVVRVLIDNEQATDVRAAAAIPGHWFEEAVSEVAPRWRVEVADDAPANCVMPALRYIFVRFMLRY